MEKFDLSRYLGTWHEIARVRNDFEPEMTDVTAEYSLCRDGSIRVVNSGYVNGKLKQITGVAEPTGDNGVLNLSFFPGIISEYRILFVDPNYQTALVGGSDKNYLWILSRTKKIDKECLERMIILAAEDGYNVENLITS